MLMQENTSILDVYPSNVVDERNGGLGNEGMVTNGMVDKLIHMQKGNLRRTKGDLEVLSNFISNSKLIGRLREEEEEENNGLSSSKRRAIKNISLNNTKNNSDSNKVSMIGKCAEIIQLRKIIKGDKVNSIKDKCCFVIKGVLQAYTLKERQVTLSIETYLIYLTQLQLLKEDSILQSVLQLNYDKLNVKEEELNILIRYYIKAKILQGITNANNINPNTIKDFLSFYHRDLSEFNIDKLELESQYNNGKAKWVKFLSLFFKHSPEEIAQIHHFHHIKLTDENTFTIITYHHSLTLHPGDLFGYFSKNETTTTILSEQNSVIGFFSKEDYLTLISPQQQDTKQRYIDSLLKSFCFSSIPLITFCKNYFPFFTLKEIGLNAKIQSQNTPVTSLGFIVKGEVKVTATLSIADILKQSGSIIAQLSLLEQYGLVTEAQISELKKKYLDDSDIVKMRSIMGRQKKFEYELNKKQPLKLYSLAENDIIGIEEAFLGIDYLSSFDSGHKCVRYYSIGIDNLNEIFAKEKAGVKPYTQVALNKINNYLMRINELKKNIIEYSHYKNRNIERSSSIHNGLAKSNSALMKIKSVPKKVIRSIMSYGNIDLHKGFVITKGVQDKDTTEDTKQMAQLFKRNYFDRGNQGQCDTNKTQDKDSDNYNNTNEANCNNNSIDNSNCPNNDDAYLRIDIQSNNNNKKAIKLQKTPLPPYTSTITNSSISNDIKTKNPYLTLNTLKNKQMHLNKGIESYPNMITKTKENSVILVSKDTMMPIEKDEIRVSLNNLMGTEFPINESMDDKDRLPLIPSFKPQSKNTCLMSKLRSYKLLNSNSIYNLDQKGIIGNIEEALQRNLENNGENIISKRIKRYYQNKKSIGYAVLKNSSFNYRAKTRSCSINNRSVK